MQAVEFYDVYVARWVRGEARFGRAIACAMRAASRTLLRRAQAEPLDDDTIAREILARVSRSWEWLAREYERLGLPAHELEREREAFWLFVRLSTRSMANIVLPDLIRLARTLQETYCDTA